MATGSFGSNSNETLDQAIDRITGQIARGERNFDSVRKGIGNRSVGQGGSGDAKAIQGGPAAIRARLQAIYANTGITPTTYNNPAASPGRIDSFSHWKDVLAHYGLEGLAGVVETWVRDDVPPGEIAVRLREAPEFKQRFPAMEARKRAGLPAISPEEYINFERQTRQMMMQSGLPSGFYDSPEDFTTFISNDVSVSELSGRIQNGFTAVAMAPPAVRDAFGKYFGAQGPGALAAYFIDPSRALPELEKQVAIAQVGGAGKQFGFNLSLGQATGLADTGVGFEGARQGFEQIGDMAPIFSESISEKDDFTAEKEGVDTVFGLGGDSKEKVRRRVEQRRAAFGGQGGAGAAASGRGVIGLGAADSR